MKTFEGTLGPWNCNLTVNYTSGFHIQTDKVYKNSYIGEIGGGFQSKEEIEANALLVAVAPELLEALQNLLKSSEIFPELIKENEAALLAINKALNINQP